MTLEAGAIIMRYYETGHESQLKADKSPVTDADLAANAFIVEGLARLTPGIPIVSEEGDKTLPAGAELFWLVDPLDGTKSFIRRKPTFTVNIGLIHKGKAVLGAIDVPAQKTAYWGDLQNGAFRLQQGGNPERIRTRPAPAEGLTAIISHSHSTPETDAYLQTHPIHAVTSAASSLKFCRVAEGTADLYPRFGPTMEWDTAAGHAILNAAGGRLVQPDGSAFLYGKKGFKNGNFVALGFLDAPLKQRRPGEDSK